ncbi:MAG: 2-hydroxymuconate tautomerase [Chloroflexota bacterium]
MPSVHVYMHEGRTQEQKKALVQDITEAVVKNTGAPADATEVILHDVKKSDWAKAGVFASERQ